MMNLKTLEIRKFGRVRPVTLSFAEGKNVVLGRNATGKTTLLELVAALGAARQDAPVLDRELDVTATVLSRNASAGAVTRWSYSRTARLQDSLSEATSLDESPDSRRRLDRTESPFDESIDATMSVDDGSESTFQSKNGQGELSLKGAAAPAMSWTRGADLGTLRHLSSILYLTNHTLSLKNYLFPVTQSIERLDEGVELFSSILSTTFLVLQDLKNRMVLSGRDPEQAIRRRSEAPLMSIGAIGALPNAVLAARAEQGAVKADVTASLSWVADFLDVESIEAYLPPPTTNGGFWQHTGLTFRFKRPHAVLSPEQLSFGQKRLFTFGCVLDTHPYIVVADELVNGMHYDWIKECLERLGDRQAFLTSQNPLLVDLLEFASVEEVQKTFIICSAEPGVAGEEELVWRNMTTAEAERFFEAYQGVRYVSEILMDMGLW